MSCLVEKKPVPPAGKGYSRVVSRLASGALYGAVAFGAGLMSTSAQAQSMEERLRTQLRATTTQLQQAQNELAVLKAGHAGAADGGRAQGAKAPQAELQALQRERDAAQRALEQERGSTVQAQRQTREMQQQAQAAIARSQALVLQYKQAYDELLKLARTADGERQRLQADATRQQEALGRCEAQNVQLYAVGGEILRAYETLDIATLAMARQPFAAQSRVKLDEAAQQYGDALYRSKFDVRASTPAEAAVAPSAR